MSEDKLIVTVTPNPSWIYPDLTNHPTSPEEIAESVYDCFKAGASIAHIHAPKMQAETVKRIRSKCDILLQLGLSGESLEARRALFELRPDMISIMLTHHDEQFTRERFNVLHLKEELEEYCRLCAKYDVKPEFEVWHLGAVWNLRYLEEKGILQKPYFLSVFLGWPGGSWSPPKPEELLHRIRNLPNDSIYSVSVMDSVQFRLLSLAIAIGGHVRVGTEDYPFAPDGSIARDNTELVSRVVGLAKTMGREVATPKEAREILKVRREERTGRSQKAQPNTG